MLAERRHQHILSQLEAEGAVRVIDLAANLGVAEETIRRDLTKLDRQGYLQRTHGGAVVPDTRRQEIPVEVRQAEMLAEKQAIAAAAVELVEEEAVIALDASTTVLEFARLLPDKPLTVVTNSLLVARTVAEKGNVRLILAGGEFYASSWEFTGPVALQTLERYNITQAFLSCRGVDLQRGMSEASERAAQVKQAMLDFAERSYLLADHTKLALRSAVFIGKLSRLQTIVTDDRADAELIREWAQAGMTIHTVTTSSSNDSAATSKNINSLAS